MTTSFFVGINGQILHSVFLTCMVEFQLNILTSKLKTNILCADYLTPRGIGFNEPPFTNLYVCMHTQCFVPRPKTTAIGLGVRLVHTEKRMH